MFDKHPGLDRRCIINLYSGNAIEGVLVLVKPTFIIRAATMHTVGEAVPTPMDGEISIDPVNVDFIQILD